MSYSETDTDRRLGNLISIGTVKSVDVEKALAEVDLDGPDTDFIPWLTRRAGGDRDWWAPEVGEQVMVAAPSGELANAVIIGSLYRDAHPEPADSLDVHRTVYADGTVVEYDRAAHQLSATLHNAGQVNVTVGPAKITMNAGSIKFEVGGSSIEITAAGVTTIAPRIDWNS